MRTQAPETQEFLERGSASYFDAVHAMGEFQEEILKQSKAALSAKLSEVSRLFGLKKSPEPEDVSERRRLQEGSAELYVRLELDTGPRMYVGLEWRRDAETGSIQCWAFVDVWVTEAEKLWDKLKARNRQSLHRDGNEIYTEERCVPGEVGKLRMKLERLLDRWCFIWRKSGGIAAMGRKI